MPKFGLDLFEHFHAASVTLVASRRLRVLRLGFGILQDERIVIDAQETAAAGVGAAAADANEAGQIEAGRADLLSHVRTERRKLHAAHRQVAVMQRNVARGWLPSLLVIERMIAMSFIAAAHFGRLSAI